ncbi:MAG: 30S ribosomal protein S3 [Candidatus Aenigmatarchaeota archaeon]
MALERKFVKEGIRNRDLEEFLSKEFDRAGYSHSIIQRTPLSIRITIFARKPGLIIGRGGKNIEMITGVLKERFGFENPQLDVQEIDNPDVDAHIIAKWIASSIERGLKYKRVANIALERVMNSGAAGVAIRISGKVGGDMGRTEKFSSGYINYSGEPAETMVDTAYAQAIVKLGMIGIQVRVMKEMPNDLKIIERVFKEAPAEEVVETEEETEAPKEGEAPKTETPKEPKAEHKPEEKKEEPKQKKKPVKPKPAKKKKEAKPKKAKKKEVETSGDNKKETIKGNE